jgi:hypothetical protein
MGIGYLGNNAITFKRKFRWRIKIYNTQGATVISNDGNSAMCRLSARPSFSFDEQEVNHVTEKVFLPGRPMWEPIEITVYDIGTEDYIYTWLQEFYEPENGRIHPVAGVDGFQGKAKKKTCLLQMMDGAGATMETWTLQGCWPQSINWGELDFSSSETADITFTMRYDRATLVGGGDPLPTTPPLVVA